MTATPTASELAVPLGNDYPEIRESIRRICAGFPGEYWRDLDARSAYPDAFVKALTEGGWLSVLIPEEYGGAGLPLRAASVILEEIHAAGCSAGACHAQMYTMGTLLRHGSAEQKQRFLPGIIKGEVRWCQGYSEPGSGSDLASLSTKCEDKGDHWLVNGQKIWTSGAHTADWCFCLVRTDTSKKHEGISFIVFDMKTPGVDPRPLTLINGGSVFCETFFTDVKVPKDQMVGPLNGGWTIAKRLLQFERDNISGSLGGGGGGGMGAAGSVEDTAKKYIGVDEDGRLADLDLRRRIIDHKMENHAFGLTIRRTAAEAKSNSGPSPASSIMKYAGAKIAQDRNELLVEAMGHGGLGWEGEGFNSNELQTVRGWLRSKGNSIEGGTSEININVVSKRVLGLPDPK